MPSKNNVNCELLTIRMLSRAQGTPVPRASVAARARHQRFLGSSVRIHMVFWQPRLCLLAPQTLSQVQKLKAFLVFGGNFEELARRGGGKLTK